MPDTAARLAREAGIAGFEPSQLVDPELNLRLGTLYLDQLTRRFDGAPEAVARATTRAPAPSRAGGGAGALADADVWVEIDSVRRDAGLREAACCAACTSIGALYP